MSAKYDLQHILELACAAQRVNGSYVKTTEFVYDENDKPILRKEPNRFLIDYTLGLQNHYDQPHAPVRLEILPEDKDLAMAIKSHFRKFMFSVIKGEDNFESNVGTVLNSDSIQQRQFGYVACLPSVYQRDVADAELKSKLKTCLNEYLAETDTVIKNLDCEVIEARRSNNFDAWNICAIVDNKLASWFSKSEVKVGPAIIIKGKIKEHRNHWKYKKSETRLNYVKVIQ